MVISRGVFLCCKVACVCGRVIRRRGERYWLYVNKVELLGEDRVYVYFCRGRLICFGECSYSFLMGNTGFVE